MTSEELMDPVRKRIEELERELARARRVVDVADDYLDDNCGTMELGNAIRDYREGK